MTARGPQHLTEQRRAELLLDALTDYAIYMLDVDGFITSWNAGAQNIKGYRSIEIIGQHFSRFFTAEDRAARLPEKILDVTRTMGRHEAEGWRVRKDGSRFWCNAILQRVVDETGQLIGFVKITRDISERVAAQQALLESEHRFRVLVEGVIDYAIYMLDPSGVVTNWNTGAERLKGYSAAEIIGQHFSRFYSPEERSKGLPGRALETAAREGRHEAEGWRVRKDGSRFWASVVIDAIHSDTGELVGFAKVTRDITERRAALDALRASERQFRLLIAGVTDYAIFMLDPNGIVTSWNAGAQRIKGYGSDDIIGQHFSKFYTEQDRAAGLPARAMQAAAQEGRFEMEGWRVRKDGSLFWANVVIQPIRDEAGELLGFAKITRDITERRQAQQALQEAQTQRAHAQKMDALGQLTGGVAHDFNNLLTVVSGHIQTLKKKVADDPKAARAAEAIEIAAGRGAVLTRQLLTFSRRQTFNPVACRIVERLDALSVMLTSSIGSRVKLITTVGSDMSLKVDVNEFELAIVNLVLNARDAMPNGGMISISAEKVAVAPRDTPAGLAGEFVALRVSDTGSGIPADVLARVFDPFFTTKQADKGSGLGLSQVHGFAHQSGGTVTIDSELGRGTTVTLYLPPAAEEPATLEEMNASAADAGEGRVLVVEDNPDVAEVTIAMLEQLGYDVATVRDADAALALIEQHDFDLVLSDVVMAGSMDGLGLARSVRERRRNLPVLLMTGYSDSATNLSGEFVVMRKPVELSELSRAVGRLIAEARQPPTSNVVRLQAARRHTE